MFYGTRHFKITILILLLLLPLGSFGCAHAKPLFFNDSDKVESGEANTQPPTPTFEWVLMSKGKYRTITTANPTEFK